MSDTSMGAGWWLASDGKWYAPEQATHLATPTLPSIPTPTTGQPFAAHTAPHLQISHTFQPPAGYKLKKKRRWPWVLLAVLVLFVIGAAISGTAEEKANTDSQSAVAEGGASEIAPAADAADSSGPLTVGSTDSTSGFDVTLLQVVDPWSSSNQFESPEVGNRFVAVELDMVNTTDEVGIFSTLLGLEIIDSLGQRWNPSFAGLDLPQLDGDVAPGQNIRGWQVFEVPADATGLRLRVVGSLTASGIEFQL